MKTYNKTITKMERAFLKQGLEHNKKAFAGFYLTLKAYKLKPGQNVMHLKSQPIVACPGSLLHLLGIWTDRKLQSSVLLLTQVLASLLPTHQHGITSHGHPTLHSTTSHKHINLKKITVITGNWIKIHPNTKSDHLMEPTQKNILQLTISLHTPTIPLLWKTTKQRNHLLRSKIICPIKMDATPLDNPPPPTPTPTPNLEE